MSSTPAPGFQTKASTAAQVVSWVLVAFILIQAGLSGPALFQEPALFELHGWLGMGTLLFAAALVILTFIARLPMWARITALLLTVGSFGQIGLGYAGHRSGVAIASAVHVPLGVALLGLAVALAVATHLLQGGPARSARS